MFQKIIETVRKQCQPEARANAMAGSLDQLQPLIPDGVELGDVVAGWRNAAVTRPEDGDDGRIAARRKTCGEMAELTGVAPSNNMDGAKKTWEAWVNAFASSDDPRQKAMAETFQRELNEF